MDVCLLERFVRQKCVGLIIRPEVSHRVWRVWVKSSIKRRPGPLGVVAQWGENVFRIKILFVLYECVYFLIFIDKEWLGVFEKSMVRTEGKILGPKRGEITGQRRRLNKDEAQYVYCWTIIWLIRWLNEEECDRRVMCHVWRKKSAHRVLVEKPEGKRPLGRPWCKEDHRWRAIVNAVMNFLVSLDKENLLISWGTISLLWWVKCILIFIAKNCENTIHYIC